MKIIYEDLLRFLEKKPSKKQLSDSLFQLGHEHELCENVFNLELTPNRGDCLSLNGLARDLNVFYRHVKNTEIYEGELHDLDIKFENLSVQDCPHISFLEIEIDDTISDYEPYLENYFLNLSCNKTNFFTDISNYLSYEQGQPTHCFDSNKIKDKIVFQNKKVDQKFTTLLDKSISLEGKNCVFTIGDEIISLAGIMGGLSTACNSNTRKVLIECAYFNPESIIGKSVKYNLVSDAAHKFERGVDPNSHDFILRRFIQIVRDHVHIKNVKLKSFAYSEQPKLNIKKDHKLINTILGIEISDDTFSSHLESLGFNVSDTIEIPTFRNDIKSNNDIAEEIARVIGYDNIMPKPIEVNSNHPIKNENKKRKLRSFLSGKGFNEVINYPFSELESKKSIKIDNPLDSNRGFLRTNLKDHLVENLLYNERRQKDSIKLFEISDVYYKDKNTKTSKIGIIACGRQGHNYKNFSQKIDNKFVNSILKEKNLYFDEISRDNLASKSKDKIFYFEGILDDFPESFFEKIDYIETKPNFIQYNEISNMPSSTRDISYAVESEDGLRLLIDNINDYSSDLLKKLFIFDFYVNKNKNIIKIGFRFVFQSKSKSINVDDIEKEINPLIKKTTSIKGVNIPGM